MRFYFLLLLVSAAFVSTALIRNKRSEEESNSSEEKEVPTVFPISKVKLINGEYVTFKDKDPEEQAKDKQRDCIPRDQAGLEEGTQILQKTMELEGIATVNATFVFNDTSPIQGQIVDEVMEVKIYKPLCDD